MTAPIAHDRGRVRALEDVLAWQEQGEFQLPADVLTAAGVMHAAQSMTVPEAPPLRYVEDAARLAVDLLERGEPADPVELAGQAAAGRDEAANLDGARRLIDLAVESAASRAVAVATDACDRIICYCLQPAYQDMLDQARELALTLHGVDLNTGGWDVPKKVQEARRALTALADRHQVLRVARGRCIGLAGQLLAKDTSNQFSLLREPQNLAPGGYRPGTHLPKLDIPVEPPAALLWLVTEGEPGHPWLPTVTQQDDAWAALHGSAEEQRMIRGLAARAHAGMNV